MRLYCDERGPRVFGRAERNAYRRRLGRGRRLWDLAARGHKAETAMGRAQRAQWSLAVEALALMPGEIVLDLGCGAGGAFAAPGQAVGSDGRVVGTDYSPRMLAQARATLAAHGWDNVEVRHGDASADPLGSGVYDAAIAAYSLSTVPDLHAAIEHLYAALCPGGRAFVGDVHFGWHPAARLLRRLYRMITAGNGDDIVAALCARFDSVEPVTRDDGRALSPQPGKSWPPITYVIARKARH
jgi:ubiquinone/menaquinone biosynthesis C-methylase UbiE